MCVCLRVRWYYGHSIQQLIANELVKLINEMLWQLIIIYFYTTIYIKVPLHYIMCEKVCLCVCVLERERERERAVVKNVFLQ